MEGRFEEPPSLQDLASRIWGRRGIIGALVLLASIGAGSWVLLQLSLGPKEFVYFIDLRGIEKSRYPGGASFSPNDLRSPEVLRAAIESQGLDQSRLNGLAEGLAVEYGSPQTYGIIRKHKERLSAKGLSPIEIDARNSEFKDELQQVTSSSLRLALNLSVAGLSPGDAARMLEAIPAQWTRIYSERYRIFLAPELRSAAVPLESGSLKEPADVVTATKVANAVRRSLEIMANDSRVNYLVNSFGHSPSELLEQVDVFAAVQFRPLSESVLGRASPVADSYRANVRLKIQYLNAEINSLDRIADMLSTGREGMAAEKNQVPEVSALNQLQLGGGSLATIVGLAERASNAEFLREVLLDRQEVVRELADAEVELARLELKSSYVPSEEFIVAVEDRFAGLASEYGDLYSTAVKRLRVDIGTLYSVSASPTRTPGIALPTLLPAAVGVVLAALFLGILAALVLPDARASGV